ncbi:arylesterase [Pedobacter cryophilus]|uniref:Arylesterase n=1 Tax=Pedobacter cryophilus TaxID=2571271 RepID=A0A4U1C465_9SPHI|nr:arylesterase [Pedobacter cryophilus]TKC00153.1 arylesterase [Pedobacter cryophilus]
MLRPIFVSFLFLMVLIAACTNQTSPKNEEKQAEAKSNETASVATKKNILFFGTSLTAGYGLDPTEAYPALIQQKIDSLKLPYKVINGGLSGETSAAGKSRIDWLLKQPVSIFVLELGANDGLRGIAIEETTANLQAIIDKVKEKYPDAKLVMEGMQLPPNMGEKYATDFKAMFKKLANKNKMVYVDFLLEGVGGVPKLNQNDGIHPTAEGHQILAKNVWVVLENEL